MAAGADVNPPNPTTTSGRAERIIPRQKRMADSCDEAHLAIFAGCHENPEPGMRSNVSSGYFSRRRESTFFWLTSKVTT
jgi:hypothetical protein